MSELGIWGSWSVCGWESTPAGIRVGRAGWPNPPGDQSISLKVLDHVFAKEVTWC